MGIKLFSSSSYDECWPDKSKTYYLSNDDYVNKNPDPHNYKIENYWESGNILVVKINYPNCTNYEGNKILVYKDVTIAELVKQGSIDPHFSNNEKFHSPIARFVPTNDGLLMAIKLARMLANDSKGEDNV